MKIEKPSIVLVYTGWVSVFIEIWLLLLRLIPADKLSLSFLLFFFFLSVMASAVYSGKPKTGAAPTDFRVIIGDQVFSKENGNLKQVVNSSIGVFHINPNDVKKK